MNADFFQNQIRRLATRFGDRAFDQEFVSAVWRECKEMANDDFLQLVGHLIETRKHTMAPVMVDFREAKHGIQKRSGNYGGRGEHTLGEIQPHAKCECADCGDSGFVRIKRVGHADWANCETGSAACHCRRGARVVHVWANRPKHEDRIYFSQYGDHWTGVYEIEPQWP